MLSFSAISHHQDIPDNFVYLRELIPDLVQDTRYFSSNNFIGERITGYDVDRLICTLETAVALKEVQLELSYAGLALKVFDAYRPQRAVDHFIRWAHDLDDVRNKQQYYPHLDKADIFAHGYLKARSSHSRGSTVDLTIIDQLTEAELDMGTAFDFFDPVSWPSSLDITAQQRANRMLLRSSMTKHGFVPVDEEWWHFTLQDEPYPQTWFDFPIR